MTPASAAKPSRTRYRWDPIGGRFISRDVSPQAVGEAVERITEAEGGCPPHRLVDEARPRKSPLHSAFEWDDQVAGEAWRVQQARQYIHVLRVETPAGDPSPTPTFVSVHYEDAEGERVRGYRPVAAINSVEAQREEMLRDALSALEGLQRRFDSLTQLEPVWAAVKQVRKSMSSSTNKN